MKNFTAPIILALSLVLFVITLIATTPSRALPNQPTDRPPIFASTDIYTSGRMPEGIVATSLQSIYGPQICTAWGDPFSPMTSSYTPGVYTYRYRIEIPADYPSDVLRVEIFDPDSMNSANNDATIEHSNAAILASGGSLPQFRDLSCDRPNRKIPCLIRTDEVDYRNGTPFGGLSLDQVNPLWFLRVDENRGNGTNDCANTGEYNESVNTKTLYELYYYRENNDSSLEIVPLASYTGQDGQEAVDHETDLHWVSPGAEVSFGWDKDAPGVDVPANPGARTEHGFEIDLSRETPNIVTDPATGNRYIYLDITSISGGSENNFELWAGPPDYVNSVPSNVNARNIFILNNPGSHSSKGVNVYAINNLPQNSNITYRVDIPLTNITPEQAGESIYISLFDPDAGTQPPITFYLDTIAEEDWSLTFGIGGLDPDGITSTVRCLPGSCDDEWIDPAYEIKLPSGTKDCDFSNPNGATCTPFYGGRLIARYQGGSQDTYGWQITTSQNETHDPTTGCDAFPMAIHEGIRSVSESTYDALEFSYPGSHPTYESFIHHQPDVPMLNAKEGMIFKVVTGSGPGNLAFLRWNAGISATSATLQNSLAWPGNTYDYTDHNDGGQVLPGQSHVVRGFIEAGDASDTELHIGDWIAANSGVFNSTVYAPIEYHIDLSRTLRLPLWNENQGVGSNIVYKASTFAIFRIHGYNLSEANGGPWILLEFIRFDESCGQVIEPLTNVEIGGTTYITPNTDETFSANILPLTATQPISYTWEATDFAPVTHQSGDISDTISFNWAITGTKTITVTAVNAGGSVTDTHILTVSDLVQGQDLTIIGAPKLITPLPLDEGNPVQFEVTVKNIGDTNITSPFFIDLFVNPSTINPEGIPPVESAALASLNGLSAGTSQTVTLTLDDGLPIPNTPHQIYAMVDTLKTISEVNETNNISDAAPLDPNSFITWHYIYLPSIIKNLD